MIIVTGPGRGGTSFIAALYRELGFDPGGVWVDSYNAGFEDHDVVRANGAIVRDLGMSILSDRAGRERVIREHSGLVEEEAPPQLRSAISRWVRKAGLRLAGEDAAELDLMPWGAFDEVVERYRTRLNGLAASRGVVKDPMFCWTLGVWAAASVPIDHMLLSVRNIDAMVASRRKARQVAFVKTSAAKNAFIYGIGMCVAAAHDYRIPYSIVQFPDFLEDMSGLYDQMRFPQPVTREDFEAAFQRIERADLVHDRA